MNQKTFQKPSDSLPECVVSKFYQVTVFIKLGPLNFCRKNARQKFSLWRDEDNAISRFETAEKRAVFGVRRVSTNARFRLLMLGA